MASEDRMRIVTTDDLDGAVDRITAAATVAIGLSTKAEADALITGVLEMAEEWAAGRMALAEVRQQTNGQERFLAMRFTRPAPRSLVDLIDALIDASGGDGAPYVYRTKAGMFTEHDIRRAGGVVAKVGEDVVIRFSACFPDPIDPAAKPRGRWD